MAKRARRSPGEGALYQRGDGMWIATVDLGWGADGKRKRKTVSARKYADAQRKLQTLRREIADAGGQVPTGHMSVEAWLARWLDEIAAPRVRPSTLTGYRNDVTHHIAPVVGRYRLDKLAPQHVRAMGMAIVGKGRSSTTALRCHRILSRALSDAMREGIVVRNVAALVDAPRKAVSTRGALTAAQAITLLTAVADDPMGSRWAAALLTGARRGELLGLERERVGDVLDLSWQLQRLPHRHGCGGTCGRRRAGDCPHKVLDVPAGFDYRPLVGGLALTRPKTRAGHRVVPLVEPLRSILLRHIATAPENSYGLVWATPDGQPVDPSRDSAAWRAAVQAAGLPPVPLHAARHTAATLLLEAGVDRRVISEIIGHSSEVATRGYQHVDLTLARDAMTRLGALLGTPPALP